MAGGVVEGISSWESLAELLVEMSWGLSCGRSTWDTDMCAAGLKGWAWEAGLKDDLFLPGEVQAQVRHHQWKVTCRSHGVTQGHVVVLPPSHRSTWRQLGALDADTLTHAAFSLA